MTDDPESTDKGEEARRQDGTTTPAVGDEALGGRGVAGGSGGDLSDGGGMSDVALDA